MLVMGCHIGYNSERLLCNIVLNEHTPTEDRSDCRKDSFYEELHRIFDQFPKHRINILLGCFSEILGTDDIFISTIGNTNFHEIKNNNTVRIINIATSKISLS
jgi:hypothetical protein